MSIITDRTSIVIHALTTHVDPVTRLIRIPNTVYVMDERLDGKVVPDILDTPPEDLEAMSSIRMTVFANTCVRARTNYEKIKYINDCLANSQSRHLMNDVFSQPSTPGVFLDGYYEKVVALMEKYGVSYRGIPVPMTTYIDALHALELVDTPNTFDVAFAMEDSQWFKEYFEPLLSSAAANRE